MFSNFYDFLINLYLLLKNASHLIFNFIFLNDYLNPYTLTFKNPKTTQMFNIIILYHYVMSYLYGILIFTFIFVFLSFFRSYLFFHYHYPYEVADKDLLTIWNDLKNQKEFNPYPILLDLVERVRFYILKKKSAYLSFYKADIKKSLTDQVTHAPVLEFLWVVFPAIILVFIAYPSLVMLYYNEAYIDPVYNITVIGNQWYWTYEYNDFNLIEIFKRHITNQENGFFTKLNNTVNNLIDYYLIRTPNNETNKEIYTKLQNFVMSKDLDIVNKIPRRISVDCNLIIAKDPKFLRLLTTDQCLVIPSKTPIRFLITSNDVIHSWAIPSYGIKMDAVPGRINQQILSVPLVGTSWGQCSELCGVNHAYMPIEVKVLAFGDFLFYMELRIREVLMPYLLEAYKYRLHFIKNYLSNVLLAQSSEQPSIHKNFPLWKILQLSGFPDLYWDKLAIRSGNKDLLLKASKAWCETTGLTIDQEIN